MQFKAHRYTETLTDSQLRLLSIEDDGVPYAYEAAPYPSFDPKDVIVCNLNVHETADKPVYDALSYTWNNPFDVFETLRELELSEEIYKKKLPVICDGQVLFVGASLHDALLSLRASRRKKQAPKWKEQTGSDLSTLFWIDAICIDQNNIAERNAQVSLMNVIYRHATQVFIWLGPDDAFGYPAIELIGILHGISLDTARENQTYAALDTIDYAAVGIREIRIPQWCALFAFFARTWFRRAWIVQEVVLARNPIVMCGNHMLSWRMLANAGLVLQFSKWSEGMTSAAQDMLRGEGPTIIERVQIVPVSGTGPPETAAKMRRLRFYQISDMKKDGSSQPAAMPMILYQTFLLRFQLGIEGDGKIGTDHLEDLTLLTLLVNFRYTECFNPRDKVYAMCGIWQEHIGKATVHQNWLVKADYKRTIEQVYTDSAWAVAAHCKDIRFLSYVSETALTTLPSWVPDWSARTQTYALGNTRTNGKKPWKAAGDLAWTSSQDTGRPNYLQVQGHKIDRINVVASYCKEDLLTLWDVYQNMPMVFVFDPEATTINPSDATFTNASDVSRPEILRLPSLDPKILHQTRWEVLWRTILCDIWQSSNQYIHPAPNEAGAAHVIMLGTNMLYYLYTATEPAARDEARHRLDKLNAFGCDEDDCNTASVDEQTVEVADGRRETMGTIVFWGFAPQDDKSALKLLKDPGVKRLTNAWREWEQAIILRDERKLFGLEGGLVGNGPPGIEVGDEVWILAGCDEPCVLRKRGDGTYRFVGVAYVHGIMHGELLKVGGNVKLEALTLT